MNSDQLFPEIVDMTEGSPNPTRELDDESYNAPLSIMHHNSVNTTIVDIRGDGSFAYSMNKPSGSVNNDNPDCNQTETIANAESAMPFNLTSNASDAAVVNNAKPEKNNVSLTFPQMLMEILDDPNNAKIIAWLPHGRAFVVYRKRDFACDILPNYFPKCAKYSSFTRKLNRWGYVRVTRGIETGAYYHHLFQKNQHPLVLQMTCHKRNGSQQSQRSVPPDTTSASPMMYPNYTGIIHSYYGPYHQSLYPTIDQQQQQQPPYWSSSYGMVQQQCHNTVPIKDHWIQQTGDYHSESDAMSSNHDPLVVQPPPTMNWYSQQVHNHNHRQDNNNRTAIPFLQPNRMIMDPQMMRGLVPPCDHHAMQQYPYQNDMHIMTSPTYAPINDETTSQNQQHQLDCDELAATTTAAAAEDGPLNSPPILNDHDIDPINVLNHHSISSSLQQPYCYHDQYDYDHHQQT